jgi:hypothetical protein
MKTTNPLVLGFIEGITPQQFDRVGKVTMPILENPKLEVIRQHAAQYGVGQRTIYRWLRDGVSIEDPLAVAAHLANQRGPSPAALAVCKALLETELAIS